MNKYIFPLLLLINGVERCISTIYTTDSIIHPPTSLVNSNGFGFGAVIEATSTLLGVSTNRVNTNDVVFISLEWNGGTNTYDTNPQTISPSAVGNGRSMSMSKSGDVVGLGGSSSTSINTFKISKYENGVWVQKFITTSFPQKCQSVVAPLSAYISPNNAHCQSAPMSSDGRHLIAIPENGWARMYFGGGTTWVSEADVDNGSFAYNQNSINAGIFCGENDEYLMFGSQYNPNAIFIAKHDHSASASWADHQMLSIPVSPFSTSHNVGVGYSMKCDPENRTRFIVGNINDLDTVSGTTRIGSANIISLSGTTWSVEATFRNGNTNTNFGEKVAMFGRFAAVSETGFAGNTGRVHAYYHNTVTGNWDNIGSIQAQSPVGNDYFGRGIEIIDDWYLIGGLENTVNSYTLSGRIEGIHIGAPTPAPTLAPTPNPYIEIGTAEIKFNVADAVTRQNIAKTAITDIKNKVSNSDNVIIKVSAIETSVIPSTMYTDINNDTLLKESFATARGCGPGQCTVTIGGSRRMLMKSRDLQSEFVVSIEYSLSEADYNSFADLNNTLDNPAFLAALAVELGVDVSDIEVTATGGTVTIEITLTAVVSDDPSGTDTILELQEIQASLNNATETLVQLLGVPSDGVTLIELDLCSSRTCSGQGDNTMAGTDTNGCAPSTGICACNEGYWGVNCESRCECYNGGSCVNSMCKCSYPYFGLRCNAIVACGC